MISFEVEKRRIWVTVQIAEYELLHNPHSGFSHDLFKRAHYILRIVALCCPLPKSIPLHSIPSLRENQYHTTHSFSNEHSRLSVIQVKAPVSTCQIKKIFLKMDVDLDNTARFEIGWSVLNSQRTNNEEEFNYLPDETLSTINTEDLLIPDKNINTKETPQRF